ncbi:MAG: glycoside hydrolase family 127 protein, partial [Oscillospiraceae bacterium]|nr:glycoside hydrolase family 127 protein [Oscillospiraceae bacterium]
MYVTGGIGSTHHGEAFTPDYDLPGETAYAETCAAIGLALFARRMSQVEPDGRYADAAELAIYNGTLAGVSDDGAAFFYECPLEIHPQLRHKHTSTHSHDRYPPTQRQHKFECMCCPANLARFVASFANMLFTQDDYTVYVHHYAHAAHEHITIATQYPRDGEISLHLQGISGKRVALRIPGWCEHFTCSAPGTLDRGYYYVDIPNDDFALQLSLAMPVRLVHANPQVYDLIGRVAVMRGPIVYCLESIDNGDNLRALSIAPNASFSGDFDALQCDGLRLQPGNALYSTTAPPQTAQRLHFIPYFRFANRGEREMAVFVRI